MGASGSGANGIQMTRLVFILLCVAVWSSAGAADGATSPTVTITISAANLVGDPLEGVPFQVMGPGGAQDGVRTDANGLAVLEVTGPLELDPPPVSLASEEWTAESSVYTRRPASTRLFALYRLFPSDPGRMSSAERQAYLRRLPGILAARRAEGVRLPDAPLHRDRLAAFLEGTAIIDVEESGLARELVTPDPPPAPDSTQPPPRPPSFVIVDALGNTVAGRVVEIYTLSDEAPGHLELIRRDRSGRDGGIVLPDLETGRLYRVRVPEDADRLSASSPVFRPEDLSAGDPETLVLRDARRETLGGLVTLGNEPVEGAVVRTEGPVPRLVTRTGPLGFFQLAPLSPGPITITVTMPGEADPVVVATEVGPDEVLVAVDVLLAGKDEAVREP